LEIKFLEFRLEKFFVRQLGLVLSDQSWGETAAECVFDYLIVFAGTQYDAYRGLLMLFAYIAVQRLQVEIELAKIFRLKLIYLEFKSDKSVKAAMEEKQIKCKILPADLHGEF